MCRLVCIALLAFWLTGCVLPERAARDGAEESFGLASAPVGLGCPADTLSGRPPSPDASGGLELTAESLLDYIRANPIPNDDYLTVEERHLDAAYTKKRIVPRVVLNTNVNYPAFGYEYASRDALDAWYASVNLVWDGNIFAWLRDRSRAEYEEILEQLRLRVAREQCAVQCLELYYRIVKLDEILRQQEHSAALKARMLAFLEADAVAGRASRADGEALRHEMERDAVTRAESVQARMDAVRELADRLEWPDAASVRIRAVPPDGRKPPSLDECQARAAETNSGLAPLRVAAELLRRASASARWEHWTNAALYMSLPGVGLTRRAAAPSSRRMVIGLNWTLPLYDGGELKHKLEKIELDRRRLTLSERRARRAVRAQVDGLHSRWELLAKKVRLQEVALRDGEETCRAAARDLRAGIGTELNVTQARLALAARRSERDAWMREQDFVWYSLRILMGEMDL